jgi:hypothetical protein
MQITNPGIHQARFQPPASAKPLSPISEQEDEEEQSDDEGYELEDCDVNCCDKDCECDDCIRCINNSLDPYDEERSIGTASAA